MSKLTQTVSLHSVLAIALALTSAVTFPSPLRAQQTGSNAGQPDEELAEITVTANKRSQSINDVGMSITALSGNSLESLGVNTPLDLGKVVPGLTVQPSPLSSPVYTLRGVGFYESTLSAAPTVVVYQDEVAVPFSAETRGIALDVERVEVLKGPQGTVFGSNTTGGAINYVANKPTDHLAAGVDGTFGRFNTLDATAYLSGPISDSLKARLAVRGVYGGDWQYDYVRHGATLGSQRQIDVRFITDWQPIDELKIAFTATGWNDTGETQTPQFITDTCRGSTAGLCTNANTLGDAFKTFPRPPPNDPRAADWAPTIFGQSPHRDDGFFLLSLRPEYALNDDIKITSLTSYSHFRTESRQDFDGTYLRATDILSTGRISTVSQELRITGQTTRLQWILGGDYEYSKTFDDTLYATDQDAVQAFFATGPLSYASEAYANQNIRSLAGFGNLEFKVTDAVTMIGGVRYTITDREFQGCTKDPGHNEFAPFWNAIFGLHMAPGDCSVLTPFYPKFPQIYTNTGPDQLRGSLNENNVSWNIGTNYETANKTLFYYRIAKGFKAGSFPNLQAASGSEYNPVKQESLLAYEIGAKAPMLDRKLTLTGALFYYDYRDKQLKGRAPDPIFVSLDALVQIPKSYVEGAELQIDARPIQGLTLSVGGTWIRTRITQYNAVTSYGSAPENFSGQKFPYSPPVTVVGDAQYDFKMSSRLDAFVGTSVTYNSGTSAVLNNTTTATITADHLYDLPGYALLDLRAGIQSPDRKWRLYAWGRNITNKFYSTNILNDVSSIVRYTGMPATFGIGADYKYE